MGFLYKNQMCLITLVFFLSHVVTIRVILRMLCKVKPKKKYLYLLPVNLKICILCNYVFVQ